MPLLGLSVEPVRVHSQVLYCKSIAPEMLFLRRPEFLGFWHTQSCRIFPSTVAFAVCTCSWNFRGIMRLGVPCALPFAVSACSAQSASVSWNKETCEVQHQERIPQTDHRSANGSQKDPGRTCQISIHIYVYIYVYMFPRKIYISVVVVPRRVRQRQEEYRADCCETALFHEKHEKWQITRRKHKRH